MKKFIDRVDLAAQLMPGALLVVGGLSVMVASVTGVFWL